MSINILKNNFQCNYNKIKFKVRKKNKLILVVLLSKISLAIIVYKKSLIILILIKKNNFPKKMSKKMIVYNFHKTTHKYFKDKIIKIIF